MGGPGGMRGANRPAGGFGGTQPPAGVGAPGTRSIAPSGDSGFGTRRPGGAGGILGSPTPSAELTALLKQDLGSYTWVAAAVGSNNAAGYQLAVDAPVMAIGGFNGTDPAPTLAQFQALVAQKKIHWFVGGGTAFGTGGRSATSTGGSDDAARIAAWVQENSTPTTVGGTTVYDLSGAAA
jgi:hypothetical protein